jgi:O-antigen/teichoic acid export membrane protein
MRRFATPGLAYALGSAANSAALLLLLPFLVSMLSPAEYGLWALYEIAILVLTTIAMLGLDIGMMREYWYSDDQNRRRRMLGSALTLQVSWALVMVVLIWLTASWVRPHVCSVGDCGLITPTWLVLALLIVPCEAAFNLLQSLLRIHEQATAFAAMAFFRLTLFLGAAVLALLLGYGLSGALFGRLFAALISLLLLGWFLRRHLSFAFERQILGRLLRYGLPLLPTAMAAYVLLAADRYILQAFASLEAVAIYTFAYKLASGLEVLIIRPYGLDWGPRRFAIAASPQSGPRFAEALVLYLFLTCTGALALGAAAPFAFTLLAPPAYQSGLSIIPLVLLALIVYGASYPLNIGIMLNDRTYLLPWVSWLAAVICLMLNFWWIPRYGMMGAAWATLVAYTVYTAAIGIVSARIYYVCYNRRRLGLIGLATLLGLAGVSCIQVVGLAATLLGLIISWLWVLLIMGLAAYWLWRGRSPLHHGLTATG